MQTIKYQYLGLANYKKARNYHKELVPCVASQCNKSEYTFFGYILFCEHQHICTLDQSNQMPRQIDETPPHANGMVYHNIEKNSSFPFANFKVNK